MDLPAGNSKLTVNADNLASGIYFYTFIENGRQVLSKKLVIRH
jgi:hypothetical protein